MLSTEQQRKLRSGPSRVILRFKGRLVRVWTIVRPRRPNKPYLFVGEERRPSFMLTLDHYWLCMPTDAELLAARLRGDDASQA